MQVAVIRTRFIETFEGAELMKRWSYLGLDEQTLLTLLGMLGRELLSP